MQITLGHVRSFVAPVVGTQVGNYRATNLKLVPWNFNLLLVREKLSVRAFFYFSFSFGGANTITTQQPTARPASRIALHVRVWECV
jgi:hypothetical protein